MECKTQVTKNTVSGNIHDSNQELIQDSIESESVLSALQNISKYSGDLTQSDDWASAHGINQTLQTLFGDKAHIIDPECSSIHSPASNDKTNAREGAVNYVKMIGGYDTDDKPITNGFIKAESALEKPIVMIWNTAQVSVTLGTDCNTIGGSHWQTCVILPKNYVTPSGKNINNANEKIYFIDSLNEKAVIPAYFKHILITQISYEFSSLTGKTYTHKIGGLFPSATFINCQNKQQQRIHDCGWWATYNAIMLLQTGEDDFLKQFTERSRKPAYALRALLPNLSIQAPLKSEKNQQISDEESLAIQNAIEASLKDVNFTTPKQGSYESSDDELAQEMEDLSIRDKEYLIDFDDSSDDETPEKVFNYDMSKLATYYRFACEMPKKVEPGVFYVKLNEDGGVKYQVINLKGRQINSGINKEDLIKIGIVNTLTLDNLEQQLKPHLLNILSLTKIIHYNSVITHAIGIKLLYSQKVQKYYKYLKEKELGLKDAIPSGFERIFLTYLKQSLNYALVSIIDANDNTANQSVEEFIKKPEILSSINTSLLKHYKIILKCSSEEIIALITKEYGQDFKKLFENFKKFIEETNVEIPETKSKYITRLAQENLEIILSGPSKTKKDATLFNDIFKPLRKENKDNINILKGVNLVTPANGTISTNKQKKNIIRKLSLDNENLLKLDFQGKVFFKTFQEVDNEEKYQDDFIKKHEKKLIKCYAELFLKEIKKNTEKSGDIDFANCELAKSEGLLEYFEESKAPLIKNAGHTHKFNIKNNINIDSFLSKFVTYLTDLFSKFESEHILTRKTLPTSHIFNITTEQSAKSIFPQYLASLRANNRSSRREIKNKRAAQKRYDYMVDSVLLRQWNFSDLEIEYTEQQTINDNFIRTDYAMFGSQGSKYPTIVEHLKKIKSQLRKEYIVTDIEIAKHIRFLFTDPKFVLSNIYKKASQIHREISRFEEKEINRMLMRIAGLIFGTEVQRNPASVLHQHMILDLIETGHITFGDAFINYGNSLPVKLYKERTWCLSDDKTTYLQYKECDHNKLHQLHKNDQPIMYICQKNKLFSFYDFYTDQLMGTAGLKKSEFKPNKLSPLMPMAPEGSTPLAVSLHKLYNKKPGMPFSYEYNGADNNAYESLIEAEEALVKLWRGRIKHYQDLITAIEESIKTWFAIDLSIPPNPSKKLFDDSKDYKYNDEKTDQSTPTSVINNALISNSNSNSK